MAKALKKAGSKPKPALRKALKPNSNQPFKVIIEVVVTQPPTQPVDKGLLGGAEKPSIKYDFETNQITLISLSIEDKVVRDPSRTGTIELDYLPLTGEVLVNAYATGTGTGTLQLTYQNRKLLDPAASFNFNGGQGFITQKVKIN